MNKSDLILKEIPCGKRKIKYSYDVIENNLDMKLRDVVPSRIVLNLLSKGYSVEFLDENNKSLYVLGKIKINKKNNYLMVYDEASNLKIEEDL
jgi:hypothetical protein